MLTLNCTGRLIKWEQPIVMGIINTTPDSFHSDSRANSISDAVHMAEKMLQDGASILDIGGQSTRPGSEMVGSEKEAERVIPVIQAILQKFPKAILSIDTYHATIARLAVEAGASIVNDVSSGLTDPNMLDTVALLKTPYICMNHGGSSTDLHHPISNLTPIQAVYDFFIERLYACKNAGINDVIIDPGFGFGKTVEANFSVVKDLAILKQLNHPILLGVSRKSSIYKTIGGSAETALNGTSVVNTVGLLNGADILRVHDVKEAMEAIQLVKMMYP